MLVKELFTKQIDRPINGVIKADQADSESVWQELDEYVVTKELDIHFRKFFGAYLDAIDRAGDPNVTGKVGVWISGLLRIRQIPLPEDPLLPAGEPRGQPIAGQTRRAIEFFDGKIQDAMLAGDIKRAVNTDVDVILFNIDSKADSSSGRDAILRVFLKVFNEKLGYSGDHPHIADLERRLDGAGQAGSLQGRVPRRRRMSTGSWRETATASTRTSWCRPCRRPWARPLRGRGPGSKSRRTTSTVPPDSVSVKLNSNFAPIGHGGRLDPFLSERNTWTVVAPTTASSSWWTRSASSSARTPT